MQHVFKCREISDRRQWRPSPTRVSLSRIERSLSNQNLANWSQLQYKMNEMFISNPERGFLLNDQLSYQKMSHILKYRAI